LSPGKPGYAAAFANLKQAIVYEGFIAKVVSMGIASDAIWIMGSGT